MQDFPQNYVFSGLGLVLFIRLVFYAAFGSCSLACGLLVRVRTRNSFFNLKYLAVQYCKNQLVINIIQTRLKVTPNESRHVGSYVNKWYFEQRETNLMSLAFLFPYLMLNPFRMLIHPSSGACDLFVELVNGLYCSGSMCVGVTVWFGWGGVVSICRLKPQPVSNVSTSILRSLRLIC